MADTTANNVIIPEVFADAVKGAFASKNAFAGSLAATLGIVKIDGSFPQSGPEVIGETISVPYFGSIGEMTEYAKASDGTAATSSQMVQTKESATIARGTINFNVSRWARGGAAGGGLYEEMASQVVQSTQRWMDRKIISAAVASGNPLTLDVFSASAPRNIDYDLMADGLGMWNDHGSLDELAAVAVHSKVMIDMLKLKDAVGRPLLVMPDMANAPPLFFGKPLIVSDSLVQSDSSLTAVTSAGTSPPVITVAASANRQGGTGPVRPINVKIACTTGGALATWKFKLSIDGGTTYTAADYYTSAATVALRDPLDPAGGLLGVTISIAAGTANVDNTWTFQSRLKHTTLLLKRGALAFWFNQNAMGLQTIPVPAADTITGAVHCYAAAHRYTRLNGSPYPGVVAIRHNAGGL